jgi:hypothetical protein
VYPNPVSDEVTIDFAANGLSEAGTLTILNQLGEVVISETVPAGTLQKAYNLASVAQGIYAVCIKSGNFTVIRKLSKV